MITSERLSERLSELLSYNQDTGRLTWRVARGRAPVEAIAGVTTTCGYVAIRIDGTRYLAHRLAWFIRHGKCPAGEIDHINGVHNDNRIANLRDVTHNLNQQNQKRAQVVNSTGRLGVSRSSVSGCFRARIFTSGKEIHLGTFKTVEEASSAYLAAKREQHEGCTI